MLSLLLVSVSFSVCVMLMCCGRNYVLFELGMSLILMKVWMKLFEWVVNIRLYVSVRFVLVLVVVLLMVVIIGIGRCCRWWISGLKCLLISVLRLVDVFGVKLRLVRFWFV